MFSARLVVDCANLHGEGCFWNPTDGCIWWTDIEGKSLWSFNPTSGKSTSFAMPDRVCCFAPRQKGGLIVAFADRVVLFDLHSSKTQLVCLFEPDNPHTRLNDGRVDREGNFIVGGMNEVTGEANSSVIRITPDLRVDTLLTQVSCANSTCFSQDGKTMFFADTPDREICVFDYESKAGVLTNRQVRASFDEDFGLPDGSCVDSEGGLWNAVWEGHKVVRVAPNGQIDQVINIPTWKPTCCTFGGEDLETLYITTSRLFSTEDQIAAEPGTGGLFAVNPGVKGITDTHFLG